MNNTISIKNPLSSTQKLVFFANEKIHELEKERRQTLFLWRTITIVIALINLATIALSIVTMVIVLEKEDFSFSAIGPTFLVSGFTILLFILTFVFSVYENIMKSHVYADAISHIQYLTFKYEFSKHHPVQKNHEYCQAIENIVQKTRETRKKLYLKKIITSTIIGEVDEDAKS